MFELEPGERRMTGNKLKEARKYLVLTQEGLGEVIGMTRVMIGLMERNKQPITITTELAIRSLILASEL